MISNLKNHEQNLCSTTIKDIATSNIGVLKAGIENSAENVPINSSINYFYTNIEMFNSKDFVIPLRF